MGICVAHAPDGAALTSRACTPTVTTVPQGPSDARRGGLPGGRIPIWVGGNSDAGLRRAVRLGEAWHPLRFTMPRLREAVARMTALAEQQRRPVPGLAPRIALRLAESPVTGPGRLAGEGTIGQVLDDLAESRGLGADTVVLDPFCGDPGETLRPEAAWQALATVRARTPHLREHP